MSRIGKKPIAVPKGVTVKIEGNMVAVRGRRASWKRRFPKASRSSRRTAHLLAVRENDSQAAVHGLARALVNNAVEGVTKGWTENWKLSASAIAPK